MYGRSLIGLLEYEARVKPKVKLLVDRVETLTDDDIKNADVPLPWFRNALRMMRDARLSKKLVDTAITFSPDISGVAGVWQGESTYIRAQGTMQINLEKHDLVFFGDDGSMWLSYTKCKRLDFDGFEIKDRMTRSEYLELYKRMLLVRQT